MTTPRLRHVYASSTPVRTPGSSPYVPCGRCGGNRARHSARKNKPMGVCQSCAEVLRLDGWSYDKIREHYGRDK